MIDKANLSFDVSYKIKGVLAPEGELVEDDALSVIKGEIEDEEGEVIGKVKFYQIDTVAFLDQDFSLEDVLDLHSETARFMQFINEWGDFEIETENLELLSPPSLLILSRLEVVAKYRGYGLGRRMVDDIKNRFCNSTDLFLLQSFPLQLEASDSEDDVQWNNNMGFNHFEKDDEEARNSLGAYYESLGFKKIRGEFYFLDK
ncbi:hypothetical protein [Pseudoalteromonas sp. 0303]|uniref:hypothetical protein n=3 Tax=Pseudoalteromonas TaxID=53246 RepID=UPI001583BC96|nr:hypothetical protein [Pseudoalteromonas sp. 0303]NUJ39376.1 hypothetical protein [Pseudoalteromonas sp. 0303]